MVERAGSSWPSSDVAVDCPSEESMMEARKNQVSDPVENTQVTVTVTNDVVNLEEIIDARKYSDSERLLRTTAWMLRFVHNLKVRTVGVRSYSVTYHDVTVFAIPEFKSLEVLEKKFLH